MKDKRHIGFIEWLIRAVSEYLYPAKCISCGSGELSGITPIDMIMKIDPDSLRRGCFCKDCMAGFIEAVREACPECGLPACVCECAPSALRGEGIYRVYSSFVYDKRHRKSPASALIYRIKSTENRDAVNFAAYLLAERLQKATSCDFSDYIMTYVPRRRRAIRENGGDHMKLVSRLTAKILGISWCGSFYNVSGKAQKGKNYAERMISAERSIKIKKSAEKNAFGKKFILVDDIVTSGATLSSCAALLFEAGAEDVIAVTLAKAKKHKTENGVVK